MRFAAGSRTGRRTVCASLRTPCLPPQGAEQPAQQQRPQSPERHRNRQRQQPRRGNVREDCPADGRCRCLNHGFTLPGRLRRNVQ
jgi:hypothetical protein